LDISCALASHYNLRHRQSPPHHQLITPQPPTQQINQQQILPATIMADPTTRAFDSIKSFHGTAQDNSRDWCDRAEIIFNAFNINDVDRLARIGIKFENAAFDWYRDNQGPYATWVAFRQLFERAFPPPERTQNRHLLAEQINQRKQGPDESVHDYYYSLDKLCREYNPQMTPIDKAIKLVGGLREELKEKILPLNVQTPEEFMIQAKNFESSEKVMAHYRKQNGPFELPEPTYAFDSNGYSSIAAIQPHHQQPHQNYYQQHQRNDYQQNHQNYNQQHQPNIHQQNHQIHHQQNQQNNYRQYHQNYHQQNYQPYVQQPSQNNEQLFRNNKDTNVNNYQNINHRKCFQCGQTGHVQRFCPFHLKE
jgi:Retrotransposon gag protein